MAGPLGVPAIGMAQTGEGPSPGPAAISIGVDGRVVAVTAPVVVAPGGPVPTALSWRLCDPDGDCEDGEVPVVLGAPTVVRAPAPAAGSFTYRTAYRDGAEWTGPETVDVFEVVRVDAIPAGPVIPLETPAPAPPPPVDGAAAAAPTTPTVVTPVATPPAPRLRLSSARYVPARRIVTVAVVANRRLPVRLRVRRGATVLRSYVMTVTRGTRTLRIPRVPATATSLQFRHPATGRWTTLRVLRPAARR